MDADEYITPGGRSVVEFSTFEDYLNSQVSKSDLDYLEDAHIARKLVELGFRGSRDGFTQDEFYMLKNKFEISKAIRNVKILLSAGKTYEDGFLRAMQMREEGNRNGKNASIFYVRTYNKQGQEISAYIDYAYRLATEDFRPIFNMEKKFEPRVTDLSYYNWETTQISGCSSPNYEVVASNPRGMVFRNKRDGKSVNPDYGTPFGDNSSRTNICTDEYLSAFVMDHYHRR
ncbi:cilia- and flagella-associated protein 299-like [Physella acuta]|uniref:cilia- and flagella-associated protein 299-like n=1 Tax=Physella acuta TaxID=109671 RepID=UPI0027DCA211|nr:cilia- and flagella-associated protein 299-like [Physella acuta]